MSMPSLYLFSNEHFDSPFRFCARPSMHIQSSHPYPTKPKSLPFRVEVQSLLAVRKCLLSLIFPVARLLARHSPVTASSRRFFHRHWSRRSAPFSPEPMAASPFHSSLFRFPRIKRGLPPSPPVFSFFR